MTVYFEGYSEGRKYSGGSKPKSKRVVLVYSEHNSTSFGKVMGIQKTKRYSIEEYIAIEDAAEIKHEYERGEILPRPYGTIDHAMLCSTVPFEISNQLALTGKKGSVIGSQLRVYIEKADCIVYPDASVFCDKKRPSETEPNAATNPTLVVEVLSKSTEAYDRGDKFHKYRQLDSLKEYVLVSQTEPKVESSYLEENGAWRIVVTTGLDAEVKLASLGISISMRRLYEQVDFE